MLDYVEKKWREQPTPIELVQKETQFQQPLLTSSQLQLTPVSKPRQDWGEAVDVSVFYGRTEELAKLEQWIIQDNCRLVALLGMGGIGKTSLSIKLAQQIQDCYLAQSPQRPTNRRNPGRIYQVCIQPTSNRLTRRRRR